MPLKPLDESNHSQLPQETPSAAVCCREEDPQHPLVGVAKKSLVFVALTRRRTACSPDGASPVLHSSVPTPVNTTSQEGTLYR